MNEDANPQSEIEPSDGVISLMRPTWPAWVSGFIAMVGRFGVGLATLLFSGLAVVLSAAISYAIYWYFDYTPNVFERVLPVLVPTLVAPPILFITIRVIGWLGQADGAIRAQREQLRDFAELAFRERQKAEDAAQAKSNFLAQMSHELRTPLNAILGFSETLRDQRLGPDDGSTVYVDYAADIHRSGTHLLSLINDILDISKIDAGRFQLKPQWCNASALIAESFHFVEDEAKRRGVSLAKRGTELGPRLFADSRAVKQILINLLSNAIKFTDRGGNIEVSAETGPDGSVILIVADSGIGIPDSILPQVFEPFIQAGNADIGGDEGTGLGLTLVKELVELQGGRIVINSELGIGTRATVTFPPGAANIENVAE